MSRFTKTHSDGKRAGQGDPASSTARLQGSQNAPFADGRAGAANLPDLRTVPPSATLQRFQTLADNSPQAVQLKRLAETLAAHVTATSTRFVPSTGPVLQGYFTKKIPGARRLAKRAPALDVYAAERRLRAAGINTGEFTERRTSDKNEGDLDEYVASLLAAEQQPHSQESEENMMVDNFGDINQSSMLDSRPASSAASGELDMLAAINSVDALAELHASKRYNVKLTEKGSKLVKPFDKVKKKGSNVLSSESPRVC